MLEKMVFSMELHAGNDPAWLDQVPELKAGALDYADKILRDLEEAGMLPPDTSLANCEDPELQVYVDNVDIPHWVVLGWDNE
jgi:hypothetical protein